MLKLLQGGAIYIASNAICNIDGASFESNTAAYANGGAIFNYGTLTVEYGNFAGNSAARVCILAPHSQYPYQKMLEIPAQDIEQF